jgi:hypothetical protein
MKAEHSALGASLPGTTTTAVMQSTLLFEAKKFVMDGVALKLPFFQALGVV